MTPPLATLATRAAGAFVAAAALFLSGCTSTTSPSGAETAAADYTESSASWAPKESIKHRTYTEAEKWERRQQWLASMASEMNIENPPEIDLIRWTTTPQDTGQAEAACLTEAGFPATYDEVSGGVVFGDGGVPDSQTGALYNASFTCYSQYTRVPGLLTDWSTDQLGMLYDYWTEAFVPCVEARGYTVEEPPSREVYVDTFFEFRDDQWRPEDALKLLPQAEREEVGKACPVMPASEHFYG
ncbi:MAG: hypothetical protein Q4G21_10840 [Dermabacter sp.]|nr:hypothetical protein [Dermabacter sp.]